MKRFARHAGDFDEIKAAAMVCLLPACRRRLADGKRDGAKLSPAILATRARG
jgi:hypothetical protein